MKAFKYFATFIAGLVIGGFLMRGILVDINQRVVANIFIENEIKSIENFLETKSSSDQIRFCQQYRTARYDIYQLEQKIEAVENGQFKNDLILSRIEELKSLTYGFAELESKELQYDCENT